LIREGIIPAPAEMGKLMVWVSGSLARAMKTRISQTSYGTEVFIHCNAFNTVNIDYHGNMVFCCDLSHFAGDGEPARAGEEIVADLNEVSLREGITRHYYLLAKFIAARLSDAENLAGLACNPCYWCLKYFGKLNWLTNYPESPWAEGVTNTEGRK
jgi:hypothetical protein